MDEDDDLFGSDLDDDDKRDKGSPEDKKFFFRKELRSMLYGFGDDKVSDTRLNAFLYLLSHNLSLGSI